MSLEDDINCNLESYTHYYTKCCETENCTEDSRVRHETFSNAAIRKVIDTTRRTPGRVIYTRQNSASSKRNLSAAELQHQHSMRVQMLRTSLICTPFSITKAAATKTLPHRRLKLEDILKPEPPLQPHSTNGPRRIEILGVKLNSNPSDLLATIPSSFPMKTPSSRSSYYDKDSWRSLSKTGRSFRPKFFVTTL